MLLTVLRDDVESDWSLKLGAVSVLRNLLANHERSQDAFCECGGMEAVVSLLDEGNRLNRSGLSELVSTVRNAVCGTCDSFV